MDKRDKKEGKVREKTPFVIYSKPLNGMIIVTIFNWENMGIVRINKSRKTI